MHYKQKSYPAHWVAPKDVDDLMRFFFAASFKTALRLARNPRLHEDSCTDELVNQLSEELVKLNSAEWPGMGSNNTVFRMTTQPKEPKTGADIGIVFTTRNYDVDITRALLIQCKKLNFTDHIEAMANYTHGGAPEYSSTLFSDRSLNQAKMMLELTPASFFLLYNPPIHPWARLDEVELADKTSTLDSFADMGRKVNKTEESKVFNRLLQFFSGPVVLPATTVKGMFQLDESIARNQGRSLSGIKRTLRYGSRFYDFMANDVFQGKIGDYRQAVINAATGENPDVFDPRYSLRFEVIDHF